MINKNRIRLTEAQLHSIIKNCVNEAIETNSYGRKNEIANQFADFMNNLERYSNLFNENNGFLDFIPFQVKRHYQNVCLQYNSFTESLRSLIDNIRHDWHD